MVTLNTLPPQEELNLINAKTHVHVQVDDIMCGSEGPRKQGRLPELAGGYQIEKNLEDVEVIFIF